MNIQTDHRHCSCRQREPKATPNRHCTARRHNSRRKGARERGQISRPRYWSMARRQWKRKGGTLRFSGYET